MYNNVTIIIDVYTYLVYEPVDLTVHPPPSPPKKTIVGGFTFYTWVSSAANLFS